MICCKLNKAMWTMSTQMTRYMTDVVVVVTVLFVKVYMVFSHKAYWSTREIPVKLEKFLRRHNPEIREIWQ